MFFNQKFKIFELQWLSRYLQKTHKSESIKTLEPDIPESWNNSPDEEAVYRAFSTSLQVHESFPLLMSHQAFASLKKHDQQILRYHCH